MIFNSYASHYQRVIKTGIKLLMKCLFPERFLWISLRRLVSLALLKFGADKFDDGSFHESTICTSWFEPPFPVPKLRYPISWFMVDQISHSSHVPTWPLHKWNIRLFLSYDIEHPHGIFIIDFIVGFIRLKSHSISFKSMNKSQFLPQRIPPSFLVEFHEIMNFVGIP